MPFVFLSVQILEGPTLNSRTDFSSKSATSIFLHLSLSSFIMSSLLLLLFALSLSVHACDARHLRSVGEENREVHLINKGLVLVAGKADQVHKISLPPCLRPSIETAEELQPKQILPVGSDKRNPLDGSEALSNQKDDSKGATSGGNTVALSSHEDLQHATKATTMEGCKVHSRLMLGTPPHDLEETVDFREGDTVEDIVVMDYAQPHRKPPIHNKDP